MTTFFTSDLHLGHARISELAGRPFASVEEMNAELVARWNAIVKPEDTVYVLGDVCMGKLEESLAIAATLEGLKLLVPGNHDRVSSLYKGSPTKKGEWAVAYREAGFRVLPEETRTMVGGTPVTLCHFPYDGDSHEEDRYAHARPKDEGAVLLHGHTHAKDRVRGRQLHVGVDAWSYEPVSEDTLAELVYEAAKL